jgi:hypothetical protein
MPLAVIMLPSCTIRLSVLLAVKNHTEDGDTYFLDREGPGLGPFCFSGCGVQNG